jgi:hypothetical protein
MLARLAADLEAQPVHDGLDRGGRGWMSVHMAEHHRQKEGTAVLLDRQPLVGEHHPVPAIDPHHMVVIIGKQLCLFTGAEGDCLVGLDVVERLRHITWMPAYLSEAAGESRWVSGLA